MVRNVVVCAALTYVALAAGAVTVRPQATDEALVNPEMGWCFYKYSNRIWAREAGRTFPDTVVMLKPGAYTLCVSVGSRQGTPEIALPLEGQVGTTRRYALGTVTVVGSN